MGYISLLIYLLITAHLIHLGLFSTDFSVVTQFSRVCLSVYALKGKRLELSTPKSVDMSMAVARHALALRSKGQILTGF